jgi:hypothetical protein
LSALVIVAVRVFRGFLEPITFSPVHGLARGFDILIGRQSDELPATHGSFSFTVQLSPIAPLDPMRRLHLKIGCSTR